MFDVDLDIGGLAALQGAFADHLAVAAHDDFGALSGDALIVEPVGDGLGLADDAKSRGRRNRDAAVALVLASGDERMYGRLEAYRRRVGGNVMDAAIGDQERAGDPFDRHI